MKVDEYILERVALYIGWHQSMLIKQYPSHSNINAGLSFLRSNFHLFSTNSFIVNNFSLPPFLILKSSLISIRCKSSLVWIHNLIESSSLVIKSCGFTILKFCFIHSVTSSSRAIFCFLSLGFFCFISKSVRALFFTS